MATLQMVKSGANVDETCRTLGIAKTTFYRWKAKYGGIGSDEVEAAEASRGRECADEEDRR